MLLYPCCFQCLYGVPYLFCLKIKTLCEIWVYQIRSGLVLSNSFDAAWRGSSIYDDIFRISMRNLEGVSISEQSMTFVSCKYHREQEWIDSHLATYSCILCIWRRVIQTILFNIRTLKLHGTRQDSALQLATDIGRPRSRSTLFRWQYEKIFMAIW